MNLPVDKPTRGLTMRADRLREIPSGGMLQFTFNCNGGARGGERIISARQLQNASAAPGSLASEDTGREILFYSLPPLAIALYPARFISPVYQNDHLLEQVNPSDVLVLETLAEKHLYFRFDISDVIENQEVLDSGEMGWEGGVIRVIEVRARLSMPARIHGASPGWIELLPGQTSVRHFLLRVRDSLARVYTKPNRTRRAT